MKYVNAAQLLPPALLSRVQKYCDGCVIYVPKKGKKLDWGTGNGTRKKYDNRNREIVLRHTSGSSVKELSKRYYLSEDSIRKILRKNDL